MGWLQQHCCGGCVGGDRLSLCLPFTFWRSHNVREVADSLSCCGAKLNLARERELLLHFCKGSKCNKVGIHSYACSRVHIELSRWGPKKLELCRFIWCGEYRSAVKVSTCNTPTSERGVCGGPLAFHYANLMSHTAFCQSLACVRLLFQHPPQRLCKYMLHIRIVVVTTVLDTY
jgi:hypothetical protein